MNDASPPVPSDRRSPPTERVVRVLRLLADHPTESFGISELARRAGIVKATCLAIANELTRAGYLVFDPTSRTYGLGPELMLLGVAAQEGYTALRAARPRAERLADTLGFACTVSTIVDGAHVVLARSGPRTETDPTVRAGQRFPFAPPWGTANVAWDRDDAVDAWLAMQPIVPFEVDRAELQEVIAAARRDGVIVELATELGTRLNATLAHLEGAQERVRDMIVQVTSSLGYREYLTEGIDARKRYDIAMVGAPTFDRNGRQELLLALFGYRQLEGAQLRTIASELRSAADEITSEVGGIDPWK